MTSRHLPTAVGLTVGGAVLAVGLYSTAGGLGGAVAGSGGVPVAADPANPGPPAEVWRTPNAISRPDGSSMTFEEYVEMLRATGQVVPEDVYETYLRLVAERFDPRGEDTREREPVMSPGWGEDLTGREGWDSSSYPEEAPLAAPAGSRLLTVHDGPADAEGRYWQYVVPPGMTPQDACEHMLANTQGLELNYQGDPCEPGQEEYMFRLRMEGGGHVRITAVNDEVPCPDGTFGCSVLTISMNYGF